MWSLSATVLCAFAALAVQVTALPTNWLVKSTFATGTGKCEGKVSSWEATSFGICEYGTSGSYVISSIAGTTGNITIQSYGSDATCSTPVGKPQSTAIPRNTLGCHTQFVGASFDSFGNTEPAKYTSTSPYGLPKAPFVGIGYYSTTSQDCSDYSQIAQISLSNADGVCLDPDGGDGTSFSISCADINKPKPVVFSKLNCMGPPQDMTAADPRYSSVMEIISNPSCTLGQGDTKLFAKQLICVDTAVATPDRFLFPSAAPTPKPHPTSPPTVLPSARPTPTPAPTSSVLVTDTSALCALYATMTGVDRKLLLNWCPPSSSSTVCDASAGSAASFTSWTGVTCGMVKSQLRVTSLTLSNLHLSGNVPPAIGNLNALTALTLAGLGLSGGLPTELGKLTAARTLRLSSQSIVGTLPPQLSALSSLNVLAVDFNSMSGVIPSQFGQLTSLTTLLLSNNKFTGNLASQIGLIKGLTSLDVSSNQLVGVVPTTLCSLPSSASIKLEGNRFSCFPQCLPASAKGTSSVMCPVPTMLPTMAPSTPITPAPTSPPVPKQQQQQQQEQSAAASASNVNATLGAGGIVGVTLGLLALLVIAFFVYRAVKYSEELPLYDETVDLQSNPIAGVGGGGNSDAGGDQYGARKDSIPMASTGTGYSRQSPALRRDTIPSAMSPQRLDPFSNNRNY